ncbi:iron-containing redox enzyme family protein [Aldersonia sp. NBC_00410]|uniref:iron-containing redox enzyme family protein n=1 Tax=Aldersonia sp. NBC_00410 TaxID=2975954 RepID=UPI00224F7248|nr:iron-containing redox enzyme family protein [Aldersonia sp. NBC_00410]MCX5043927.1 iron-containing redox enzyme family protein [Aldersonia sp. NBC_00410]
MSPIATPSLPRSRGPLSHALISTIAGEAPHAQTFPVPHPVIADPLGADAQLALYICYELHYHGFSGVDDGWEWDPGLLAFRHELEDQFLATLRGQTSGANDATAALDRLAVEPQQGSGLSDYLSERGTWVQMREFFAHRSLYHLKEGDPHAWVIPRLSGAAKAALVAVEFDEYGGGRVERMHSTLFANLLREAGMSSRYLAYLDCVPPESLATVNFMSLCGLHRNLRAALVGLFAATEITTAPSARRIVAGLTRLGAPRACRHFYTEHIEADAVHEQILRHDIVAQMIQDDPKCEGDIVFGIEASELLEQRLARFVLDKWNRELSSLMPVAGG